jgi:predicted phage terminase large subunit-like protein
MTKNEVIQRLLKDSRARIAAVRKSHLLFFSVYFSHYISYPSASFHDELFALTEDRSVPLLAITAFRGSAKSTIVSLSYVLWAIMGCHEAKYILLVGQTQEQARLMLKNIREELERNDVLRGDLGPFREEEDQWNRSSIVIGNYGAKITAVSIDQSVRGLRHGPHRPDLIICDDIEDVASAKTREGREKAAKFVKGELIPAGHLKTRTIVIGNLVHERCLVRCLKKEIEDGTRQGVYREYPLLTMDGECLWPGKYPTPESIEAERQRVGDETAWQREYLLRIISGSERVIHSEWIQYYDFYPTASRYFSAIGIDLAISQNDSADYTAMVAANVYRIDGKYYVYILPNPVNAHLTALETVEYAKKLSEVMEIGRQPFVYVEDVAYQHAMVEFLKKEGLLARGVPVHGSDKRSRLMLVSHFVQAGRVLFPRTGCEELIEQLTGFGSENNDDLADAFSILMLKVLQRTRGDRLSSGNQSFAGVH